jgi:ArsR family transcriptional regulator, arsenate/arsenite/antimonite-responsive transcriptional repressor
MRMKKSAEQLRAFARPTRLMILRELLAGVKCVTDIEDLVPAAQANISQHLAVLRHARLVDFAQDGALRCYYLSRPKTVRAVLRLLESDEPTVTKTKEQIAASKRRKSKRRESCAR